MEYKAHAHMVYLELKITPFRGEMLSKRLLFALVQHHREKLVSVFRISEIYFKEEDRIFNEVSYKLRTKRAL